MSARGAEWVPAKRLLEKALALRVGRPVLVIASGANRVDERLVASHLKADITKADVDFVRAATGFAIGGVPPLGHDLPLQTLIDQDLLRLDTIWAAAGTPHAVFSLIPSNSSKQQAVMWCPSRPRRRPKRRS